MITHHFCNALNQKQGRCYSADNQYKFLERIDLGDGPSYLVNLLNPSLSEPSQIQPLHGRDNKTVGLLRDFAKASGAGSLLIANLFSLRGPFQEVRHYAHLNHPDNDKHISAAVALADKVFVAWGDWVEVGRFYAREAAVLSLLPQQLYCFGLTGSGMPRHPANPRTRLVPQPFSRTPRRAA